MKSLSSRSLISKLFAGTIIVALSACADENITGPDADASAAKAPSAPVSLFSSNYVEDGTGNHLTVVIDQTNSKDVSHIVLQLETCPTETGATAWINSNNVIPLIGDANVTYTMGIGTGCNAPYDAPTIKLEDLDGMLLNGKLTFTLTFNVPVTKVYLMVKSGSKKNNSSFCTPLTITSGLSSCPPDQDYHETAYAKDEEVDSEGIAIADLSTCFIPPFSRWGWTNGAISEGYNDTWPIYAGAGQCDLTKADLVGNLSVSYTGGNVTVTYNAGTGFSFAETHVYVGSAMFPTDKNGSPTVAAGRFTRKGTELTYTIPASGPVYVIAHSVAVKP